jgi:hypothetical protein
VYLNERWQLFIYQLFPLKKAKARVFCFIISLPPHLLKTEKKKVFNTRLQNLVDSIVTYSGWLWPDGERVGCYVGMKVHSIVSLVFRQVWRRRECTRAVKGSIGIDLRTILNHFKPKWIPIFCACIINIYLVNKRNITAARLHSFQSSRCYNKTKWVWNKTCVLVDEKDQFLLVGSILNKVKYSTTCNNITAQSASLTRKENPFWNRLGNEEL